MSIYYSILLLFLVKMQKFLRVECAGDPVIVRQENDIIYDSYCEKTGNPRIEGYKRGGDFKCNCISNYSTVMTKHHKKPWGCKTSEEIGCKYYLEEPNRVYVINQSNFKKEIFPRIFAGDAARLKIHVWDYETGSLADWFRSYGYWEDVTKAATNFFSLDSSNTYSLVGVNVNLKKWQGQLIKFSFDDDKCLLAKVPGKIEYPVNIHDFSRSLIEGMTTRSPVTTRTGVATSESRRTTTPVSVSTTMRTPSIDATTPILSKKTTPRRFDPPDQDDNSKAPTIYLVVGVMIAGALFTIAAIFFIRRRKLAIQSSEKKTDNDLQDIVIENRHPEMHRDVSQLVLTGSDYSSYPPSEKNRDLIAQDAESFRDVESDSTSSDTPQDTSAVMDAYSGMLTDASEGEEVVEEENKEEKELESDEMYNELANVIVHHYESSPVDQGDSEKAKT